MTKKLSYLYLFVFAALTALPPAWGNPPHADDLEGAESKQFLEWLKKPQTPVFDLKLDHGIHCIKKPFNQLLTELEILKSVNIDSWKGQLPGAESMSMRVCPNLSSRVLGDPEMTWEVFKNIVDGFQFNQIHEETFNDGIRQELKESKDLDRRTQLAKDEVKRINPNGKVAETLAHGAKRVFFENTNIIYNLIGNLGWEGLSHVWNKTTPPIKKWMIAHKLMKAPSDYPPVNLEDLLPPDDKNIQITKATSNTYGVVMSGAAIGVSLATGGSLLPFAAGMGLSIAKQAAVNYTLDQYGNNKPTEERLNLIKEGKKFSPNVGTSAANAIATPIGQNAYWYGAGTLVLDPYIQTPINDLLNGFNPFNPLNMVQYQVSSVVNDHVIGKDLNPEVKLKYEKALKKGIELQLDKNGQSIEMMKEALLDRLQEIRSQKELPRPELEQVLVMIQKVCNQSQELENFRKKSHTRFDEREKSLQAQMQARHSKSYQAFQEVSAGLFLSERSGTDKDYSNLLGEVKPILIKFQEQESQRVQNSLHSTQVARILPSKTLEALQQSKKLSSVPLYPQKFLESKIQDLPESTQMVISDNIEIYTRTQKMMSQLLLRKQLSEAIFSKVADQYIAQQDSIKEPGQSPAKLPPELFANFFQLGKSSLEHAETFYYTDDERRGDVEQKDEHLRLQMNSFIKETDKVREELRIKDLVLLNFIKKVALDDLTYSKTNDPAQIKAKLAKRKEIIRLKSTSPDWLEKALAYLPENM